MSQMREDEEWQSCSRSGSWTEEAVAQVADAIVKDLPIAAKSMIATSGWVGKKVLQVNDSSGITIKDVEQNSVWLHPLLLHIPSSWKLSPAFFADVFLYVDRLLDKQLLNGSLKHAAREGRQLLNLVSRMKIICRSTQQSLLVGFVISWVETRVCNETAVISTDLDERLTKIFFSSVRIPWNERERCGASKTQFRGTSKNRCFAQIWLFSPD